MFDIEFSTLHASFKRMLLLAIRKDTTQTERQKLLALIDALDPILKQNHVSRGFVIAASARAPSQATHSLLVDPTATTAHAQWTKLISTIR